MVPAPTGPGGGDPSDTSVPPCLFMYPLPMTDLKRIGLLTGGGDCPGLNAVIRAVTARRRSTGTAIRVFGIEDGFQGLIEDRIGEADPACTFPAILTRGGTILGTNNRVRPRSLGTRRRRTPTASRSSRTSRGSLRGDRSDRHDLDALIVIGGDGTMSVRCPVRGTRGATASASPRRSTTTSSARRSPSGSRPRYTTATASLDRLHSTAASHHRVMVCEADGPQRGMDLTLLRGRSRRART